MQVIPVLNCLDRANAEEKIAAAEKFLRKGDFLHVDVADGIFTFHKTWNDPAGWAALQSSFPLESSSYGGASRNLDCAVACGGRKALCSPHRNRGRRFFAKHCRRVQSWAVRNWFCPLIPKRPWKNSRHIYTTHPVFRFSQ